MYRVLIVDDEGMIRSGIADLIRQACPKFDTIYEARDGEEALSLALEAEPDLIITDIQMPTMSGIEFIEQLKVENPDVAVIIISGYDDFEYAQKGLKLAVNDYMLKPVESELLVTRLNQLAEELDRKNLFRKDQAELQKMVKDSLPLFRERLLRSLLEGRQEDLNAHLERARELGIPFQASFYAVSLLRYEASPSLSEQGVLTDAMIYDIVQETANRSKHELEVHLLSAHHRELALLIGSTERNKERCFAKINPLLSRIGLALQKNVRLDDLHIALGSISDGVAGIPRSYQQAQEAMLFRLSVRDRMILNYEELGALEIPAGKEGTLEEQLILHVKLADKVRAIALADNYIDYITSMEGAHPHWVKLSMMELSMSLLRTLSEAKIKLGAFLQNKEIDPYTNVNRLDTVREGKAWLHAFVEKCVSELERSTMNKGASHVEKVKQYVETRFSDSQLSLSDLAVTLFLSPNYLRQLFSQETGISFVEYVTKVRMENAILLLKDPTLKIQDVAERVGFEEQRYFSSCFKKYHHMTPTEYREAIQQGLV
jgi:two-component system, response regulator YesN